MNCAYHANVESVAFCVACGRALCGSCKRDVEGSVYCEACLADMVRKGSAARTQAETSAGGESPGVAFALGLIPGVGAIYNGEFFKAAIHIVILGLLIGLGDASVRFFEPLIDLLTVGFYIYMPFEAYFTAKKRKLRLEGVEQETPIDRFHTEIGGLENKELWGGIALVVVGVLFLLNNFRLFDMSQMFPLVLIALGVWRLWLHKEQKDDEAKNMRPGGGGD